MNRLVRGWLKIASDKMKTRYDIRSNSVGFQEGDQEMCIRDRGTVHVKAPTFDGSSHWAMYLRQFEAAACVINWTEKDKAVSLVLSLKGPAAELLQKVPPDSQNIYAELIKFLELRYGDKYLREVYYAQLRRRRQRSGESLQAVSYTHLDVYKRQQ